jgi:ribosome-associated translation inhibitor RaiA
MDRPLELHFHNMKPSADLDTLIRERMARLELLDSHILGCRVNVDLQNHTHRSGNIPEVHIEIQMPGQNLVINHKHNRGGDALTAVHDAFNAATAQLREYKARKAGQVKRHVSSGEVAASTTAVLQRQEPPR